MIQFDQFGRTFNCQITKYKVHRMCKESQNPRQDETLDVLYLDKSL